MTQVLVVDNHEFFRRCLVDLVNASVDLEVVGECADGSELEAAVKALKPDIVVMDVRMRMGSGMGAVSRIDGLSRTTRVIMLTSDTARSSRAAARAYGAAGYMIKGSNPNLVIEAIREVARGGTAWREDAGSSTNQDLGQAGANTAPAVPPRPTNRPRAQVRRVESRSWFRLAERLTT